MEKELPAKEGMKEAVASYGPKEIESKLVDKLGENRLELLKAVKRIINPDDRELKLTYFASGPDVANAIVATGATQLVYVDMLPQAKYIQEEIEKIGGKVRNEISSGSRTEIDFEWEEKGRKILFYQLYVEKGTIDKLSEEMKDSDVYFEKKAQGIRGIDVWEKVISSIKVGGFHISDAGIGESLGFENIQLDDKFQRSQIQRNSYKFGHATLMLHRKKENVPDLRGRLEFNDLLLDAGWVRNGSVLGIKEEDYAHSFKVYGEMLAGLKTLLKSVSEETRKELEPRVVKTLLNAPGDMSKVLDSPENIRTQMAYVLMMTRGALLPEEDEHFKERIRDAENSPDRPTVQQLEKFVEEGRKVFREIFPDLV